MDRRFSRGPPKGEPQGNQKGRDRAMSLPAALHFNQEIAYFSKQKQYDQACAAFDRMIQSGVPPDVVTYNTMINVYVKNQKLQEAFKLFEEMKNREIDPTIVTYTSLIDGCGKCSNFGHAMILYKDVKESGIALNMHFFNAILNAGLLNGNIYIIDSVLADVKKYDLHPNTVTFNTLLAGFSRYDKLPKMKGIVESMKKMNVEFSAVTQTTILQAALLVRDQNDLMMFLDLLDTAQFTPSKNQASQAVLDLIDAHRLIMAQRLMQHFMNKNCGLTDEVFIAIVKLAGEYGNFSILNWAAESAAALGINIHNAIFISQIEVAARFADAKGARDKYLQWGANHGAVTTSVKLALIESLLQSAELRDSAPSIAEHIFQDGQITQDDADKLLEMFGTREMFDVVLRLYEKMKELMCPIGPSGSDFVISALIKKEIDEAQIDSICDLRPHIRVLSQLSQKLSLSLINRVPFAVMVKAHRELPTLPDATLLVSTLAQRGAKKDAWQIFVHFVECGLEVDSTLVSQAAICVDRDDHDALIFLVNAARDSDVPFTTDLVSAALVSAIEAGNLAEALAIKDEMDAARVPFTEEALSTYASALTHVQYALPATNVVDSSPRPVRTRRRSLTCPRIKIAKGGDDFHYPFDDYL